MKRREKKRERGVKRNEKEVQEREWERREKVGGGEGGECRYLQEPDVAGKVPCKDSAGKRNAS